MVQPSRIMGFMKYFSLLIKPTSASCNLNCRYCFYKDEAKKRSVFNHGIMEYSMVETIMDRILNYFNEQTMITIAFQGGEPTLAGLEWFNHFFDYVNTHKKDFHHLQYTLQTNGYTINDQWIELFKKHNILIGLSIDGYGQIHDRYRKSNDDRPTFDVILTNYHRLVQAKVNVNILTVITHDLAKHASRLYDFYRQEKMDYIQLIPCLPPLEQTSVYAFKPQDYPLFFGKLWSCYIDGLNHGYRPYINLFDQWMAATNGIGAAQCGANGYCAMQYVSEADGSVYPCDFYCLDHYRIGSWSNHDPATLMMDDTTTAFLNETTLPTLCTYCPYVQMCHGQCKRQRVCFMDMTNGYCGIRAFLNEHGSTIHQMGQHFLKQTY